MQTEIRATGENQFPVLRNRIRRLLNHGAHPSWIGIQAMIRGLPANEREELGSLLLPIFYVVQERPSPHYRPLPGGLFEPEEENGQWELP